MLLGVLAGCQGQGQVFENPVVGPAPPRISRPGVTVAAQDSPAGEGASRLELTSYADAGGAAAPSSLPPNEVAARVNGRPIFVAQVLQPYAPQLEKYRPHISDAEFAQMQRYLLQRDLPRHVETAVVVDAVLAQLDSGQKAAIDEQLDAIFNEQLDAMVKAAGVRSVAELQAKLAAAGSSLAVEMEASGETLSEIRKSFGERALSAQYLREAIGSIPPPTRQELLEEYRAHLQDYTQPAKVKWQQLQISFARHKGAENARQALARAQADLEAGMSFADVVRKHGDGPLAALGGEWDWTQPESVADPALRAALETLAEGEISAPLTSDKACMLVRITGRQPKRTAAFGEVQQELRKRLSDRKRNERILAVLEEIKSKAVIETMFDGAAAAADRQDSPVAASRTAALEENVKNAASPP